MSQVGHEASVAIVSFQMLAPASDWCRWKAAFIVGQPLHKLMMSPESP